MRLRGKRAERSELKRKPSVRPSTSLPCTRSCASLISTVSTGPGALIATRPRPLTTVFQQQSRDFVPVTIPASDYPGLTADVPSYAVIATVVTRADMADDLVEALVDATLADRDQLAIRAPVLAGLDPVAMRSRGLTIPLHPGALDAFGAPAR